MPSQLLDKIQRVCKKSKAELEGYWQEAKDSALKKGLDPDTDRYYQYVTGILKRRVGKACRTTMGFSESAEPAFFESLVAELEEQTLSDVGAIPDPRVAPPKKRKKRKQNSLAGRVLGALDDA